MHHSTDKQTPTTLYPIVVLALFLLIPIQALGHDLTPTQITKRLYGVDEDAELSSLQPDDFNPWLARIAWSKGVYRPSKLKRYYIPEIAEYLIARSDNQPDFCIDFGVLIDGNDHQIEAFQLSTESQTEARTKLQARFMNFKRPTKVEFIFIQTDEGWQIEDIHLENFSLLDTIKECAEKKI